MTYCDIAVIGAGPAGLAAAAAAREAGAGNIIIIERDKEPGGILNQCIHNGFGLHRFGEELSGPEYAGRYIDMIGGEGIELRLGTMALDISPEPEPGEGGIRRKTVSVVSEARGFEQISASAVVLAMGCRERNRGPIFVPGDRGSGVFSAGSAQRYLNIEGYLVGKRVVILGSGDIGLIMARRMTLEGATVLAVAEIMPYTNGLSRNVAQCLDDFGIPLYLSHTVTNVIGSGRIEGVVISQVDEKMQPIPGTEKHFDCDTLLLSVGLVPENELTRAAGIMIDPRTNGAKVNEDMQTSLEGVFACGNVLHVHDLVDHVSREAIRAGAAAARFVRGENSVSGHQIKIRAGRGIRYTVPQTVDLATMSAEAEVSFRVGDQYRDAFLSCYVDGVRIAHRKRQIMTPGEMEQFVLRRDRLTERTRRVEFCVEDA
jgi:NADPH-dependent 2,4-dienoyl-CoA reductase/sulfur reductase-like enzyme